MRPFYRHSPSRLAFATILACICTAAMVACGSDPLPPVASSFDATLTGDLELAFSGQAYFGDQFEQLDDGSTRRMFFIELQDFAGSPFQLIRFERVDWGVPDAGSYTIGVTPTSTRFAASFFRLGEDGEHIEVEVDASSGTLVINEVSSRQMRGSFTFSGEGTLVASPGTPPIPIEIVATGDFVAAEGH